MSRHADNFILNGILVHKHISMSPHRYNLTAHMHTITTLLSPADSTAL